MYVLVFHALIGFMLRAEQQMPSTLHVRISASTKVLLRNTEPHFIIILHRRPQQKKSKMHSPFFADPPKQPTNCVTKCHNYN